MNHALLGDCALVASINLGVALGLDGTRDAESLDLIEQHVGDAIRAYLELSGRAADKVPFVVTLQD